MSKELYTVSSPVKSISNSHFNISISEEKEGHEIKRGLKSRQVQLISLGGCIGTGLFVGSGGALATCGPAPLLISYMIMSFVIYLVMNMIAEMVTYLPVPGNGAQNFVTNYLDPSLGFAVGYNYWYSFGIIMPTEITAAGLVVQYWTDKVNVGVWITIFLAVIVALNFIAVKYYGEAEFWFASIKLIAIIVLIIVGIVIFFGGTPTHDRLGFRYWKPEYGAFTEHLTGGNTGKFLAVWTAIVKSGFSFVLSPEIISTTAAECVDPRRNIPKAASRFIYRLAVFYIFGVLVIGVIVVHTNPRLLTGSSSASASPFVIGIQSAGIPVLNHIINAVILTSAWSCGNSYLYTGSRTLYSMALKGLAPKIFTRVNRLGTPYMAVFATMLYGFLAYLNCSSSSSNVFTWLSNICTVSGFIGWIFISAAYLRWRRAIFIHKLESRVPYKTPLQPYGAWFVIGFISVLTLTNGYAVFFDFNGADFVSAYVTLPIFLALYASHKVFTYIQTKEFKWLIPIEEIDVLTGLDEVEADECASPERVPRNAWEKIWFWVA